MNRITMVSVFAATVLTQLASADVNAGSLISNGSFDNIGQVWVDNTGLGGRPRISPTPALDLFFPTLIDRSPCV